MGERYNHLSLPERQQIARLRDAKVPATEIARRLGRHVSTVHRELYRNRVDEGDWLRGYFAIAAQQICDRRRRRLAKLWRRSAEALRGHIIRQLAEGWSPEQIAGVLRRDGGDDGYVCHETIYRFIYCKALRSERLFRFLPNRRVRRRSRYARKQRGSQIPFHNTYAARPPEIGERRSQGHWECDLLMFKKEFGQNNVTSLVERTSRYLFLIKNPSRHSTGVMEGVASRLELLPPPLRQTLTFDRGTEFSSYRQLKHRLGVESYFCKPQAPWQKGTVENTNGRIRRYLPGETDLASVSQDDLDALAQRLNSVPRKCLAYRTPHEVFLSGTGASAPAGALA